MAAFKRSGEVSCFSSRVSATLSTRMPAVPCWHVVDGGHDDPFHELLEPHVFGHGQKNASRGSPKEESWKSIWKCFSPRTT